jgi:hypothetical protein
MGSGYDAVLSSSSLHHLPLQQALQRMAGWLSPGGVIAVAALPRVDLPAELPVELAAVLGHRALGTAFAAGRALTVRPLFARGPQDAAMPVREPESTTRQVRVAATAVGPACAFAGWSSAVSADLDPAARRGARRRVSRVFGGWFPGGRAASGQDVDDREKATPP